MDKDDNKITEMLGLPPYRRLDKDPTISMENKIYKVVKKQSSVITASFRTHLTPHHSKPPHLYGLPKIHKPSIPLRPIVSSRGSPTSNL